MDIIKFTSRYNFLLIESAVSWRSTMKAKFIACYEATSQALQIRNLIFGRVVNSIARLIRFML